MRISILGSRGYPSTYGGFETFVRSIAPWLVAQGHEVTVYGRGNMGHRESVIDGIRVVETRGVGLKTTSTFTHGLTGAIDCWRDRPDVVLVLNVANGLGIPLLRARGVPVVVNVDGIEWERDKWGRIAKRCFRLGARATARFANVLVADSQEVSRVWAADFGAETTFIPYGADIIDQPSVERVRKLGLEPGRYAIAVARLVPENNVDMFVDAIEHLDWKVPAVVVGAANYRNPLEERLERLSREGKVRWLGHVDDQGLLAELWAHSGVYFHGHSVGGTNPALLQALACSAPTVALDTPYNHEVLRDRGRLVPPDVAAIAAVIDDVLSDPERRAQMASEGRDVVESRYGWSTSHRAYEVIMSAVAKRAASPS